MARFQLLRNCQMLPSGACGPGSFCALTAIIRAFRGESKVGNFFLDMWRVMIYMFVPASLLIGVIFMSQGMPMTAQSSYHVSTLEVGAMGLDNNKQPKQQTIVVGPVAV